MNITFLGTGTSTGVPAIGCTCRVCRSGNPKDKRLRSSLLIKTDAGKNIIIDTGQDLREQCLREEVTSLEGVLYTHAHMDHLAGLDDLRRFNGLRQDSLPAFAEASVLASLKNVFAYAFPENYTTPLVPSLTAEPIEYFKPFTLADITFTPFPLEHGQGITTGYFFNNVAYCTDTSGIPDESLNLIRGCRILILGALRLKPHPKHFSFEQACNAAQPVNAEQTWLTHLGHDVLHDEQNTVLSGNAQFAYDGMKLEV